MAIQVTNQIAATALRGEDVLITLSWTQMNAFLALLILGTKVTISSSGKIGYISEVPTNGNVFLAKPEQPDKRMDSVGGFGILNASELITIG